MNGYIRLNIGGRDRDFKFSLYVLSCIVDDLNTTFEELGDVAKKNYLKFTATLMYHAAIHGARKSREVVDFDQIDVYDWIEDSGGMGSKVMQEFSLAYVESTTKFAQQQNDANEVAGEKKP